MALIPAGVVTLHKVLEVANSKRANMAAEFTREACKRGKYWHLSPGHEVLPNSGSPEKGFALEPHKENTSLRGTGTFSLGVQSSITKGHNALTPTSLHHPGGDLSVESLTMRCVLSTSHRAPAPCADGSQRDSGRWVSGCCTVKDTSSRAATLIPTRPRLGTASAQKKKKKSSQKYRPASELNPIREEQEDCSGKTCAGTPAWCGC